MIDPILITGALRSGTSMIAGAIHTCGAWGGHINTYSDVNRRGLYENAEISQSLIKGYLRLLRMDPMGQYPLPILNNPELVEKVIEDGRKWWASKIESVMNRQGYTNGPWFVKSAKICLIWPLWNSAFRNAKWIIVRRNTDDIISSCMHTGYMRAYKTFDGWRYWTYEHEKKFTEMKMSCLNIKEVWPQKIIDGDFSEIKYVANWLNLAYNEDNLKDFFSRTRFLNKEE